MTDDVFNSIKARLSGATPGPWFAHADDLIGGWCTRTVDTPPSEGPGEVASFIREEDARFIAGARADIEALLAEVERLRYIEADAADLARFAAEKATQKERAAVVAYLRERGLSLVEVAAARAWADAIERGEHRKEEKA